MMQMIAVWSIFAIGVVINVLLRGVFVKLGWDWFVAPVTMWHEISFRQAIGITIFISFFTEARTIRDTSPQTQIGKGAGYGDLIGEGVGYVVLSPILSILLAWAFHTLFLSGY